MTENDYQDMLREIQFATNPIDKKQRYLEAAAIAEKVAERMFAAAFQARVAAKECEPAIKAMCEQAIKATPEGGR